MRGPDGPVADQPATLFLECKKKNCFVVFHFSYTHIAAAHDAERASNRRIKRNDKQEIKRTGAPHPLAGICSLLAQTHGRSPFLTPPAPALPLSFLCNANRRMLLINAHGMARVHPSHLLDLVQGVVVRGHARVVGLLKADDDGVQDRAGLKRKRKWGGESERAKCEVNSQCLESFLRPVRPRAQRAWRVVPRAPGECLGVGGSRGGKTARPGEGRVRHRLRVPSLHRAPHHLSLGPLFAPGPRTPPCRCRCTSRTPAAGS